MEHGVTWLSFLPGVNQLQEYLRSHSTGGVLTGGALVVQHVLAAALVAIVLLIVATRARKQLDSQSDGGLVPGKGVSILNMIELVFEALYKNMLASIGPDAGRYFPVMATLALFIFTSNILGLIPGFSPPTDNWNTTFSCGFFVFAYYHYHGLRVNGINHLVHIANPIGEPWGWLLTPLMLPIEIVSHLARPFSLGVRLATNMVGDHAVLAAFLGLCPILIPLPFLILGFVVCIVQTMVFVLLSIVYVTLSVEESHHDDHGDHQHGGEVPAVGT